MKTILLICSSLGGIFLSSLLLGISVIMHVHTKEEALINSIGSTTGIPDRFFPCLNSALTT